MTRTDSQELRMPRPPHPDDSLRRDVLLHDLDNWSESFWRNEESGERRVQFLITLITATIAGLAALFGYALDAAKPETTDAAMAAVATKEAMDAATQVVLRIGLPALGGLLLVGLATLLRMVNRDNVTDDYKERADQLRRLVLGDLTTAWLYQPRNLSKFQGITRPAGIRGRPGRDDNRLARSWLNGGLSMTVALLNALLVGLLVALWYWNLGQRPTGESAFLGFAAAIAMVLLELFFMAWRYSVTKRQRDDGKLWRGANIGLVRDPSEPTPG
ncbi:MAG TPA: hypothetical protein VFQ05_15000 [Candidatus Eisenbacteria bacterium]|nr:hypothetical protein [Candidatus Eisenbacteria bacterium]